MLGPSQTEKNGKCKLQEMYDVIDNHKKYSNVVSDLIKSGQKN